MQEKEQRNIAKEKSMQCPACESNGGFTGVESLPNFKIWRCRHCGLEFSDPMKYNRQRYDRLYSDSQVTKSHKYTGFAIQLERWHNGIPKGKAKYVLKSYERLALDILRRSLSKQDCVLDLGCGSGRFLVALRDSGFRPLGMDVAAEPIETLARLVYVQRRAGINSTVITKVQYAE